jgi:hypothetical protein
MSYAERERERERERESLYFTKTKCLVLVAVNNLIFVHLIVAFWILTPKKGGTYRLNNGDKRITVYPRLIEKRLGFNFVVSFHHNSFHHNV